MSRPLRVAVRTQGCKVNLFDQWELEAGLRKSSRPVRIVDWEDDADVYVVNTCTVTGQADRQNRQIVYRVNRRAPEASIVVTGCQAQVDAQAVAALPGVARVVTNTDKGALPAVVAQLPTRSDIDPDGESDAGVVRDQRTRPFLKIQDGCDTGCTYCILPRARGASRSMDADEVLDRLHALGQAGAEEVVLTGLNMGEWGRDLTARTSLAALLARVEDEAPVTRVRLSSLEPRGVRPDLLEVLASSERICHHLHLPLQAGSDRILKAMHRPYRRRFFVDLTERLFDIWPDLSLGSDIICGFPGEDDQDWAETRDVCEDVGFSYLHAFPYSRRPLTEAARRKDDVSPQTKKLRIKELRALSQERQREFAARHVGRVAVVVAEERTADLPDAPGRLRGLTGTYVPVWFRGPPTLMGHAVPVHVTHTDGPRAFAEQVEVAP